MKTAIRVLILGLSSSLLMACSSTETVRGPACPSIQIPVEAAKLTRFLPGPGRDIIDQVHSEAITGFAHQCAYDTDSTGAGTIQVYIAPVIFSTLGPANTQKIADFEYFIAVADSQKTIMDKVRFNVSIPFIENLTQIRWQREIPNVLNIPVKSGQTGADFQVFIGLQLKRDEFEYQRSIR